MTIFAGSQADCSIHTGFSVSYRMYSASAMSAVSVSSKVDKVVDKIVKSPEDARLYRGLELKNGMKILLISDPTTDKSAASLDVHIGIQTGVLFSHYLKFQIDFSKKAYEFVYFCTVDNRCL